ncbi:TetR/AcrR family transcriptional regulator [Levilactobacillus namurensis]|uniref:TetR/AcrR family transcriptional regulator n=1 Tax=Levilactobacillus namurensis TaxID=380393 RepID=UPI001E00A84E|nr:TetR/AcrR family transcriptional regulator [Levilactobacillus namurensis]HJE45623.1 TetR/AcrR family transcriptional regulator [Levilactobacillus namurensis]
MEPSRNQRKRGKILNNAIFEAAITILEKDGYDAVTFQNVAKKAQTSRSVLYRRWETPFDLLYAAANAKVLSQRTSMHKKSFNTGTLEGDLEAVLTYMFDNTRLFPKNLIPAMMTEIARGHNIFNQGYFADTHFIKTVFQQAIDRGELSTMPSDLQIAAFFQIQRYYMIFELNQITPELLTKLTKEVLLPIYLPTASNTHSTK